MSLSSALTLARRWTLRPVLHGFKRPIILRRMARPGEVSVLGHRLRTDPEVFHPTYFASSLLFAEHIRRVVRAGASLLDMGTGSGIVGVVAAARGARVTACDINPHAVRLARENGRRNGVPLQVFESDLFSALPVGARFKVIAFNIPFYPHDPTSPLDAAFRAGRGMKTVRRFVAEAPRYLMKGGSVEVVFSEDCDRDELCAMFASAGFVMKGEQVRARAFERFHILSFDAPSSSDMSMPSC